MDGWMTVVGLSVHWFHVHAIIIYSTVERVHWFLAKAQFEQWVEEHDSIHNEAKWVSAYFHTKAEESRQSHGCNSWLRPSMKCLKGMHCIISDVCMGGAV
jgi:hypothetical protein